MTGIHSAELLLDTHALLWWLAEPDRLSPAAHRAIADPGHWVNVLPQLLAAQGFEPLPATLLHGLLAAQAELGGLTLVSMDPAHQAFPCTLLW